eukprot:5400667-Pleurochrysis_carterae.AAC.5
MALIVLHADTTPCGCCSRDGPRDVSAEGSALTLAGLRRPSQGKHCLRVGPFVSSLSLALALSLALCLLQVVGRFRSFAVANAERNVLKLRTACAHPFYASQVRCVILQASGVDPPSVLSRCGPRTFPGSSLPLAIISRTSARESAFSHLLSRLRLLASSFAYHFLPLHVGARARAHAFRGTDGKLECWID